MLAQPRNLRRIVVGLETGIASLAVLLLHEPDDAVIGVGKDAHLHGPAFTHGTADRVLSIDTTRNVIVPQLRNAGYSVDYHEWDGGHGVSSALLEQSVDWYVRK